VSWLSKVLGRADEMPQRAAELARRLNNQRSKWLDAIAVECEDGKAVIGPGPGGDRDPFAATQAVSAFQAVHVLSMVHANQYVPPAEMTRFTTVVCTALTDGKVTDAWRRAVDHYTDLKSRPLGEQLLLFAEDVAIAVTGSPPSGMLIGPGLVPLANEFLHRNLGLAAGFFGDESTVRRMADIVDGLHREEVEPSSDDHASAVLEWLKEKAGGAPTLWRVVMDATDLRLRRHYPKVLSSTGWSSFNDMGVIGGCVALALQLHVDVPEQYRTPLERSMRAALSPGISDAEAAYEDCVRKVREALLAMPRAKRHAARHVLIAMWVLGTVDTDDSLINDANLVAEVAQVYENETSGYWVSV
jgi:hypothetical protein